MATSTHQLSINDGSDWHFVNGDWVDGDAGLIRVPEDRVRSDGDAMQGMHFAFALNRCYQDCTVDFEFKLEAHSDTGIIFRARDESHFYVLHFSNCGQACRAQHFWAALSKMDDSGYLRLVKMDLIRRVPSTLDTWLSAAVTVIGKRVIVRVGDYGRFEVEDDTYIGPGAIGLYNSSFCAPGALVRNVTVQGEPSPVLPWPKDVRQAVNWSHPVPDPPKEWQEPRCLLRFDDGELLMPYSGLGAEGRKRDESPKWYAARSADSGRTWSSPESWVGTGAFHLTPTGRLIHISLGDKTVQIAESTDRGRTWSDPVPTSVPAVPPTCATGGWGTLLNLDDGAMIMFGAGGHNLTDSPHNVWTWGGLHCQAYACRSEDDGLTWSDPVNVDTPGFDPDGNQYAGNLDLTEQSPMQLSDGRIMVFFRPIYSPWMWETWSDDGGRTWGPCVRGPFPGYATPNVVKTASGALLVAHRLPQLTIHCSQDDGRSWQGTIIDSGLWAMGAMCEVEPDLVLYCYMDTFEGLMRSQFLRVTPTGLEPACIE